MKTSKEFIETIKSIDDQELCIIELKKYLSEFIDYMGHNWSPFIVEKDIGYYHSTYITFPLDNISVGYETFEALKKFIE